MLPSSWRRRRRSGLGRLTDPRKWLTNHDDVWLTNYMNTNAPARNTYRTLASGTLVWIGEDGTATLVYDNDLEGPTCSICDGLGHGYPGGGPCPLEMGDDDDPYERYLWALEDARR